MAGLMHRISSTFCSKSLLPSERTSLSNCREIWSELFSDKDVWIIPKSKELGFEVVDLAVAKPESFPLQQVLRAKEETGMELVTTTTLGFDTNLISPDPEIRKNGIRW